MFATGPHASNSSLSLTYQAAFGFWVEVVPHTSRDIARTMGKASVVQGRAPPPAVRHYVVDDGLLKRNLAPADLPITGKLTPPLCADTE